jgi:hypothetical protein
LAAVCLAAEAFPVFAQGSSCRYVHITHGAADHVLQWWLRG